MPSADFCHMIASPCGSVSPDTGPRGRSPGVNTHLCAHERRVYVFGLRWIEDFALCCRLVPPNPPDSILVHRPVRLRYPAVARRPPSRAPSPDTRLPYRYTVAARCAHSRLRLAFPFHSNPPPSGWVWDLMSFKTKGMLIAPFRIRAVPGTQPAGRVGPLTAASHP
jgi:hypothetical protein